jgi:hypothetical protein
MKTLRAVAATLSLLPLSAAPALAYSRGPSSALEGLRSVAGELGVQAQDADIAPVSGTAADPAAPETPVPTVETLVNYEYGDIIERLERTRRVIYRGRGRNRRRVGSVPDPSGGVTEADRIARGQVSEVILHASLGAGACEGTVNYLLRIRAAAHFMVCRNGRVYQMVDIEDVANHVKNDAVNLRSIGIETESGHVTYTDAAGRSRRSSTEEQYFWAEDWDPKQYWIMYASIAGIIRAVAREARIPRDLAHIRTHEEADAGERDGHTDPGGIFDGSRGHVYPEFQQRYPGQNMSPYQWLMRLVTDDTPPSIVAVIGADGRAAYRVRDTDNNGLAYVRVWRFDGPPAATTPKTKVSEYHAEPGMFPDAAREVAPPTQPGDYSIIARDLVGNITGVQIRVEASGGAAPPALAMSTLSSAELASFETADEPGTGVLPRPAFAAP